MKKRVVFITLLLLGLIFFACEFNIPKAVEFKGNPTVRFRQEVNVGEKFTSILADEILKKQDENEMDDMTILTCKNTEIYTDIIHMKLFDEIFEFDNDQPEPPDIPGFDLGDQFDELINNQSIILSEDRDLINKFNDPMEIPFSSIGSLIEGFEFVEHKIKLYVSGSDIIDKVLIDIKFDTKENGEVVDSTNDTYFGKKPNKEESDIEIWEKDGYTEKEPPSNGFDINLPLNGKDLDVYFRVYIPKDEELYYTELKDAHIKVEVVVWLPFTFEAKEEEATISFPDDALFSSTNDLFGRDKPDADSIMIDIIQSLNLEIKFDINPFKNSTLIITSKGIELINPLKDDDSFPFIASEEDMKKINSPENWPFTPNFKMKFSQGDILQLPNEFKVTEFIFNANVKYRVDF